MVANFQKEFQFCVNQHASATIPPLACFQLSLTLRVAKAKDATDQGIVGIVRRLWYQDRASALALDEVMRADVGHDFRTRDNCSVELILKLLTLLEDRFNQYGRERGSTIDLRYPDSRTPM